MYISTNSYIYLSKLIAVLVLLYGGGTLLSYLTYVFTGINVVGDLTNGIGLLFLALLSTFSVPLALALLMRGDHRHLLLRIIAIAWVLNGLIRLSILWNDDLLMATGSTTPAIEFVVFGLLGVIVYWVKPRPILELNEP